MKKGNFLGIVKSDLEFVKFSNVHPGNYVFLKVGERKPTYLRYEAMPTRLGCYWAETGVFDPYESWRKQK